MQKKYKCFLFDLDGTLLDTAPGIFDLSERVIKEK